MKLGRALKMVRARSGLKQREVSERVGITQTYLSMLECNRRDPRWSTLCSLCEVMGIQPHILALMAAQILECDPDAHENGS